MTPEVTAQEWALLLLRLGMIGFLYLFLATLLWLLMRDLRARARLRAPLQGRLLVLSPGATSLRPGQQIPLSTSTSLGRAPHNSVVLADPAVSARHATLSFRDGRWWLRDEGSTNGTRLNQRAVTTETALEYGDVLEIGPVRLKLAP